MWRYQKPGFKSQLVAGLQRQQECSHYCDVLLKAKGASVFAHSCVLSAASPLISSLSSPPPPPAGTREPVEFKDLEARTLLHMVELLYSGEMAGEGERERRDALSAAAQLGIDGLVEVTRSDRGRRTQSEAAVQTEREGGRTRWRREVRDGVTLLWKESESSGGQDVWTQTEELPVITVPHLLPPPPAATSQTADVDAVQSNSQFPPPQFVPVSIVYKENQWAPPVPLESTAVGSECVGASVPSSLHFNDHAGPYGGEPHAGLAALQAGAAEEVDGEHFERFQGDIPGFLSYFLNPEKGAESHGRRARRKRGAAAGGTRRAGRPRGPSRGRGRGLLTQTVDVQEVLAAGRLQTLYLYRLEGRPRRSGQGGGAAGRKLQIKTREFLKSSTPQQKRRASRKEWQLDQTGGLQLCSTRGRGGGQRGRKSAEPPASQVKSQSSLFISLMTSPAASIRSAPFQAGSASSQRNQLSTPPPSSQPPVVVDDDVNTSLAPDAETFLPPAPSLLHTCSLPPPAPLPHDEHIDRLLEEVMLGLDILPRGSGAARSPPAGGRTVTPSRPQCPASNWQAAPEEVIRTAGSRPAGRDECVLQQVCEPETNTILDQLLQSYERYVNGEEKQTARESGAEAARAHTVPSRCKRSPSPRVPNPGTPGRVGRPQAPREKSGPSAPSSSPPRAAAEPKRAGKTPKRYPLSPEKKVKLKMAVTIHDVNIQVGGEAEKQLQQFPVVRLRRSRFLPVGVMLRDSTDKQSGRTEVSPAAKKSKALPPEDYLKFFAESKIYPIRSRLKGAGLIGPVKTERRFPSRAPKKTQPNADEKPAVNRRSNDLEKEPRRRAETKRESNPGDDVTATKRVCLGHALRSSGEEYRARLDSTQFASPPASVAPVEGEGVNSRRESEGRLAERAGRECGTPPPRWVTPPQDEDVDVIGCSGPAPDPVTISWTDSSEEEEQEVEVD